MNTSPFTPAILSRSVIAVPPLARNADLTMNRVENLKMIAHLEAGGVSTLLYGGNANLYHVRISEYPALLRMLAESAADDTLVVPSVGPGFGTMMDQAAILRDFDFPTAMILPQRDLTTAAGIASGVRRFVEAYGKPAVLYIKYEGWIDVPTVRRLVDDGLVSFIKYAIVREDTSDDEYLNQLTEHVDRRLIVSGIGEQPAIIHMRDFGLAGFTSGCVCVAPRRSTRMLHSLLAEDYETAERIREQFLPLEDLRNEISPVRVLHAAVAMAGIADTGPMLPLLSDVEAGVTEKKIESAARELLAIEQERDSADTNTTA